VKTYHLQWKSRNWYS